MTEWRLLRFNILDYAQSYRLQKQILQDRIDGKVPDHLILVQHNPVITIGRNGKSSNILVPRDVLKASGIEIYEIERGGDVTYHGPGQLTGYPIVDLRNFIRDVHWYLRQLEEVIIKVLKEYDITGQRVKGYTGVWVAREKIAAIGVAVRRWVTYHGFALNVSPDLRHFSYINPCGITDRSVTSISQVLRREVSVNEVMDKTISAFEDVFNVHITTDSP